VHDLQFKYTISGISSLFLELIQCATQPYTDHAFETT